MRKRISLASRLISHYLSATLVSLLIIGLAVIISIRFFGMRSVEDQLIKQAKSFMDDIKQVLYLQRIPPSVLDNDLADKIAEDLSRGSRHIRLYDRDRNLLSDYIDGIKQDSLHLKASHSSLNSAVGGNYAYSSDGRNIFFDVPIAFRGETLGVLEIVYPLALLNQILSRTTLALVTAGSIFTLAIIALSIYLARITAAPIKRLVEISREYSEQNFSPIKVDGPYEIGLLSDSIERMGEKIQEYINRQKQFVSNVSHELRTPLTVIKGYSDYLRDEVRGDSDLERAVYHLSHEAERLTKLVNGLLALSRMDTGDGGYAMKALNLTQVVVDVAKSMDIQSKAEGITLIEDLQDDVWMSGDYEKLFQVIVNIIDNSIKYSQRKSEVIISLQKQDRYAVLKVKDEGMGIPASDIDKIFDRFYRAQNTKGVKGTGLGLSISKQIIEDHQGLITVSSDRVNGTTVTITLPVLV